MQFTKEANQNKAAFTCMHKIVSHKMFWAQLHFLMCVCSVLLGFIMLDHIPNYCGPQLQDIFSRFRSVRTKEKPTTELEGEKIAINSLCCFAVRVVQC